MPYSGMEHRPAPSERLAEVTMAIRQQNDLSDGG
jgi:hypothetical protein